MSTAAQTTLADGLARLQLELPPETQQKLLDYVALVQKWNKVYNLTAVRETDKILTHHLLDSLAVVPHVANATTILDVGSGAGLPGIPLALALPQAQITLLDSNQKKTAFLHQALIELQLRNAGVVCERAEKYQSNQLFSVVVSRAFSDLAAFVAQAGRLVAPLQIATAVGLVIGSSPTTVRRCGATRPSGSRARPISARPRL